MRRPAAPTERKPLGVPVPVRPRRQTPVPISPHVDAASFLDRAQPLQRYLGTTVGESVESSFVLEREGVVPPGRS